MDRACTAVRRRLSRLPPFSRLLLRLLRRRVSLRPPPSRSASSWLRMLRCFFRCLCCLCCGIAGVGCVPGECFCPSHTPGRGGSFEGRGTPRPLCADLRLLLATAAPVFGVDGAVRRTVDPSIEPLFRCSRGRSAGSRARWWTTRAGRRRRHGRVARSRLRWAGERVTGGRHLRQPP